MVNRWHLHGCLDALHICNTSAMARSDKSHPEEGTITQSRISAASTVVLQPQPQDLLCTSTKQHKKTVNRGRELCRVVLGMGMQHNVFLYAQLAELPLWPSARDKAMRAAGDRDREMKKHLSMCAQHGLWRHPHFYPHRPGPSRDHPCVRAHPDYLRRSDIQVGQLGCMGCTGHMGCMGRMAYMGQGYMHIT